MTNISKGEALERNNAKMLEELTTHQACGAVSVAGYFCTLAPHDTIQHVAETVQGVVAMWNAEDPS